VNGTLAWVRGSWHKILDSRVVNGEMEYLLASFDWWKVDSWVTEKEVETTMVDVGQFD
jgi:hypothetical protein